MLTKSLIYPKRQPLVKSPKEYGMDYEPVEFTTDDEVTIKAWLIPGKKKKGLIIMTHPMPFTRYGFAVKSQGMMKVSKVEVELLRTVKQLHAAGYWVLTLDFRNHGESGKGNGGATGVGLHEWPDVVAAVTYVAGHPKLKGMPVGFASHCMGANATIMAMSNAPSAFERIDLRCLAAVQPVSMHILVPNMLKDQFPIFKSMAPKIDKKCTATIGHSLAEMSPKAYVKDLRVPTLYVQVKSDPWTVPDDIQGFYDATPGQKELFWIEGDLERFDGYNYFGAHPERLLGFFRKYM